MQKIGNSGEPTASSADGAGGEGGWDSVLVLEGALAPPGAALIAGGVCIACESLAGGGRRGAELFDVARSLIARVGGVDALDAVVVGRGPGSYTGLRVALAIARGLISARSRLLVRGIDAPRVVARAAGLPLPARVAIRWGRLRVLLAEARADGSRATSAGLIPVSELPARSELAGQPLAVLPGCEEWRFAPGVEPRVASLAPVAAMAQIAAENSGRLDRLDPAQPMYLVPPDAVLPHRPVGQPTAGLRALGPSDAEEVHTLIARAGGSSWSSSMVEDELQPAPTRAALGLAARGRLGGVILLRWDDLVMEVMHVAVEPAERRRSLGRGLLEAAIRRARELGLQQVDLEVAAGNVPALRLYEGAGFVPVGRRPRYYANGEDAVLLSLRLRR